MLVRWRMRVLPSALMVPPPSSHVCMLDACLTTQRASASSSELSVCHVEQLYTQTHSTCARLVLDASTRVAVAAGSSLIGSARVHFVVDHAGGSQAASTVLVVLQEEVDLVRASR